MLKENIHEQSCFSSRLSRQALSIYDVSRLDTVRTLCTMLICQSPLLSLIY
jgi:hypothetical protein